MNLLDKLLRRRPPVSDLQGLADFVDENAAFLVQKGMFEYSRARAGHYSKVMFGELEFQNAIESSRWRAYPLGLAMVGEVAVDVVEQLSGEERRSVVSAVTDIVLSVFDRYPVPSAVDADTWRQSRRTLAVHLSQIGLHPAKRAMDIPETLAESYFEMMPIHESMRSRDIGTTLSFLKLNLVNIHTELGKRMNATAMVQELRKVRAS